jgi:hypothetical protein
MELFLFLLAVVVGGTLLGGTSFPGSFWTGLGVIAGVLALIFMVVL